MSLDLIETEIGRFLSTDTPELLCIKGRWGVGKTYAWRKFLAAAKASGELKMSSYSYVSLFGLNSLADVRYALFENTVTGVNIGRDPDADTLAAMVKNKDNARKLGQLGEWAAALFNRKGVAELIQRSAYLMVHKQLVCLDDLERAGAGLNVRDVLGLASQLKEERKCKVVLLLNDAEHDQKAEFERQLEKVADATLLFDLNPHEAVAIGLAGSGKVVETLKSRIVELGITNIRVIRKIERLAYRLVDMLTPYDDGLVADALATLALASWSVQDRSAPPLEFLRSYNGLARAMRANREQPDPVGEAHARQIEHYPFRRANELDQLIMDGAVAGYFVEAKLLEAASAVARERLQTRDAEAFSAAWQDHYHGSLAVDDNVFLDALETSAIAEAKAISALNINSAINVLRECGRDEQADQVLAAYIAAHAANGPEFFDLHRQHFSRDDKIDTALVEAFATRRAAHVDAREPLDVLREIGEKHGWSEADVLLMQKQSAGDFERMFEGLKGDEVRASIEMIRALAGSHGDGNAAIGVAIGEAMRRIAAKSELRARKVRALGFDFSSVEAGEEGAAGEAPETTERAEMLKAEAVIAAPNPDESGSTAGRRRRRKSE